MEPSATDTAPPVKRRKTQDGSDARARREFETAIQPGTAERHQNGASASNPDRSPRECDNPDLAPRACENCRRCKLRCSREDQCSKCLLKGIPCVYENDKRRGPRPGYIEELYRRMDTLEHMVIGQSLIMRDNLQDAKGESFQDAVLSQKRHLRDSGRTYRQSQSPPAEARHDYIQPPLSPCSTAMVIPLDLSQHQIQRVWNTYVHMIQPWIPILHIDMVQSVLSTSEAQESRWQPVLRAVFAAAAPLVRQESTDEEQDLNSLQRSVYHNLLQSATVEELQAAAILQFLMLGQGRMSDTVGLTLYLPQLALRMGLYLEDHNLNVEHRTYSQLVHFVQADTSWAGHEGARRLFWNIFLLDQISAVFSGMSASIDSGIISRLLPCDGKTWLENNPVYTREFVPATVAVEAEISTDSNIGGFAYLIEATEILRIVSDFALKAAQTAMSRTNQRTFLQEFLNLDLILVNWKSRLPARFQRASYDENGYMDHNITLAHLSHNTSVIILYQSSRTVHLSQFNTGANPSSLFPTLPGIKQAAKETAKICNRFLLHRQYLVSPQFAFCQFIAARALLAYSSWTMEQLDEDFEILYTSLGESARRWRGTQNGDQQTQVDPATLKNFAADLLALLKIDMNKTYEIDLTTPCAVLLAGMKRMAQFPTSSHSQAHAQTHGGTYGHDQSYVAAAGRLDRHAGDGGNNTGSGGAGGSETNTSQQSVAANGHLPMSLAMIRPPMNHDGTETRQLDMFAARIDPEMDIFSDSQFREMDTRIFSWQDG